MSDGGLAPTAGNWICPNNDCRHVNFPRRNQCNKCNQERSACAEVINSTNSSGSGSGSGSGNKKSLGIEIGKAAAEKSRGLFSAEDWQCTKCGNVNWARRQTCNMCNAPRYTEVEERTGYGGGYNDRGVVEYKEREESDSEYDEFGRLKKRKNKETTTKDGNHRDELSPEKVATDNNSDIFNSKEKDPAKDEEDEDEEEEEDDDDADLSKYDLWGDDGVSLTMNSINMRHELESEDSRSPRGSSKSTVSSRSGSRSSSASSSSDSRGRNSKSKHRERGSANRERSRSPLCRSNRFDARPRKNANQNRRDIRDRSPLAAGNRRRNR